MTTYYVSKQRGNDTNNGTNQSTPWATVTKAVQTVVAGDTVYIGSGTYREKPVNSNAGTSGSIIQFIGDPDSQYIPSDTKGIVRVTGCGVDEIPTTGKVWDRQKDYVTLKNMVVDGSSDSFSVYTNASTNGRENINLVVISKYGIYSGINTNCFGVTMYFSFQYGIGTNCIGISSNNAYSSSTNTNCIGIGANSGFSGCTNVNCIGIGGKYSLSTSTNTNCISICGETGFYSNTSTNCYAINCITAYNGVTIYNCKASMCNAKTSGTIGGDGTVADGAIMLWTLSNMQKIIEGFEPWMFEGVKQCGSDGASAGTVDILGRNRRMLGGVIDIGAYAFSNIAADFTNYQTSAPSVSLTQQGMKFFKIPAKANTQISVSVQTNHANTTTKPQILLRGDSIAEQSATNTSDAGTWQNLTVTATPTKDEVLTLVLYSRDSATNAVSYFSDISIT